MNIYIYNNNLHIYNLQLSYLLMKLSSYTNFDTTSNADFIIWSWAS